MDAMDNRFTSASLKFLDKQPEPVARTPQPVARPATSSTGPELDRLPQQVVDQLMCLKGVDGVWIERNDDGQRVVVIHYNQCSPAAQAPHRVEGLPTRVVGGEPIRAQSDDSI
jgi:hypothetical protein